MVRLLVIFMLLFSSCNVKKSSKGEIVIPKELKGAYTTERDGTLTQKATDADLAQYAGKVISSISYCKNCSGSSDLMVIDFDDSTTLKIAGYKYEMEIKYIQPINPKK